MSEVLEVVVSASVSIEERDRNIVKFYPRVKVIAKQRLNTLRIPDLTRRELMFSEFQSAAQIGLLRAAESQGDKLTQAYADVAMRREILQYQRATIRQNDTIDVATGKPNPAAQSWTRLQLDSKR